MRSMNVSLYVLQICIIRSITDNDINDECDRKQGLCFMDKVLFFSVLEQTACVMALAYLFCLLPRNEQQQHVLIYKVLIGAITAIASILLIEHCIINGIYLPQQHSFIDLDAMAFIEARYSSDSTAITRQINPLAFGALASIMCLVGLYFSWLPLAVSFIPLAVYGIYFTDLPMGMFFLVLFSSSALGLIMHSYKTDILGDIKALHLYGLGLSVQFIALILIYLLSAELELTIWLNFAFICIMTYPLATLAAGHLLSKQIFYERDRQAKLQDDFLFKNQLDIGNIGIAITSKSAFWLKVNPYICKMFQYTEKELMQLTWKDLTYPDDLDKDLKYFNRMIKGEISEYEIDKRFVAKDGSIIYTHLSVACRHYHDDTSLIIAGFLDITQLKRAENALRSSKEQLDLVLDSSDLGIWDWDIKRNTVASNLRSAQILGCGLAKLNSTPSLWINAIFKEDRKNLLTSLLEIRKGKYVNHRIEYRLHTLDGNVRWILDMGKVVDMDEQGMPLRMCGTHTDITELKRSQETLGIAASVFHHSSEAMSVFDRQGVIINSNPAFNEITGFSQDEIRGQHLSLLQSDIQFKHSYHKIFPSLSQKGHWQGELILKRKNGQEYTAWLTINAISESVAEEGLSVALFSDISDKKQAEELIWLQANYDTLSGLPNRRMLLEHLKVQIATSARDNLHFALLFLDLDFFKEINDTLGHDVGDLLLIKAAERIKNCTRDSDLVARLGGDEFTVVLNNFNDQKGIERVANKILKQLSEPFILGSETAYISCSIGITLYPDDATTIEALLKNADQAMYSAKAHGRNRFHYFTPQMQEIALWRMKLIQDLKIAIKLGQFELYYQPIIDFSTGDMVKAEALIRWHHPQLGFVSPADFIPIAEDTGMIIEIGNWVFNQACQQAALWQDRYGRELQISINKSPVQFRDEHTHVKHWEGILAALNLSPSCICVEITEGLLLEAETTVEAKLLAYRDGGIQVSLDDFGTGYSSLSYLKKFDIDYLKIDRSFVSNLEEDDNDLSLCEAIIVMAHKLGIKVIAEGIETELQRSMLELAGCDYGQGYLFSKPLKAEDFEKSYFKFKSQLAPKKSTA